ALAGYAAVRRTSGLLVDLLAASPGRLGDVLAAAVHWLSEAPPGSWCGGDLKAMATPTLAPALDALGFGPIDYKFLFVCDVLDPAARESAAPRRWYVTPGD